MTTLFMCLLVASLATLTLNYVIATSTVQNRILGDYERELNEISSRNVVLPILLETFATRVEQAGGRVEDTSASASVQVGDYEYLWEATMDSDENIYYEFIDRIVRADK